jgi:autotransporter-associated beta strand protein
MSIDGPLTCDHEVRISKTGTGPLWLNGPVEMPGSTNYFKIEGGQLYLTNNVSRNCRFVAQGNSTITQSRGSFLMRMMRISQGSGVQYHQTGGVMAVPSYDAGRIGEFSGTRGYYTLDGGEFHVSNTLYLAERAGSYGVFRQTGGLFEMRGSSSSAFSVGSYGQGLFIVTGGTNDVLTTSTSQAGGFYMGTNGQNTATVSGTGTLFRTSLLQMGNGDRGVCTNIFNINDGAVVKANRFRKLGVGEGTHAYVNVDGGTLMPTFAWGWGAVNASDAAFYPRSPDHIVIWKKGLVVDTSENASNSSAGASTFSLWFNSPTGKGVESVALPTSSSFNATNYLGIARVVFEDETGWGASAYAEYDFTTKKITKIVVTSRGCDYSDGAKAYLESPDRSTRYECALTLSSNDGMAGELVKRGAPTLELYATNTITGGIAVEGGSLIAYTTGVIPSNTPVRVESGATLDLANKGGITVSTFTGAGNVTRGSVTVTNAVRASCAELFAGKHATFASNLTFAPGATFTITDPENLAAYAHSASATAFTASAVNGTPTLAFEGVAPQGVKWTLFKKGVGTYNFGAIIGTMILIK